MDRIKQCKVFSRIHENWRDGERLPLLSSESWKRAGRKLQRWRRLHIHSRGLLSKASLGLRYQLHPLKS